MKPRIFVGPHEVAGYYTQLSSGFKLLGYKCDFVEFQPHKYSYREYCPSGLVRCMWILQSYRVASNRSRFGQVITTIAYEVIRSLFFIRSILRYDVFIFGFGISLLRWNLDLPLIRLMGKKVIMNMSHGAEMRPPYIDGGYPNMEILLAEMRSKTIHRMASIALSHCKRVQFIERHTDFFVGAALSSSQFATRRFINTLAIGVPFSDLNCSSVKNTSSNFPLIQSISSSAEMVRVLHSPSNPKVKGTDHIRSVIRRLQTKGILIDYVEVIDRPHSEVIKELMRCDLVVDQLYSDGPLCGLGTEASWFGKPVLVAGYGFDILEKIVSPEDYPPSMTCSPKRLESALEELLLDSKKRRILGLRAQRFVRKKWNSIEVARRYERLLKGDIPDSWWIDPNSVKYLHGAGQADWVSKECIRALIAEKGLESLQLKHKPELEIEFEKFSKEC